MRTDDATLLKGRFIMLLQYTGEAMKRNEEVVLAVIQSHLKRWPHHKGNLSDSKSVALKYVLEETMQNRRVRESAGI